MSDCIHPYDDTRRTKIQAKYDNVPIIQIYAHICTDCNTIIDLEDDYAVDGTTVIIGEATRLGCEHTNETITGTINIVDVNTGKTLLTVKSEICEDCGYPVETVSIDLREETG